MIKILKPGNVRTKTCDVCECEFSYEEEDIQHDHREYIDSLYNGYHKTSDIHYVICPCCEKKLVIGYSGGAK